MLIRTSSTAVFACKSRACAPPPVGTGGSISNGGGRSVRERVAGAFRRSSTAPKSIFEGRRTYTDKEAETLLKGFSHKGYTLRRVIREDQDWGKGRMSFDILDRNGKKVGWGDFQMDVYSRGKIEIYNIHVDRAHQGKGIGRALIKMFVKEGKKLGATGLSLTASSFPASDKYGGDQGAAVWGKLGFKFSKWADLAALAVTMESFAAQTGHKWPRGLVKRVRDRKATIQEVMDADPGNFLTGELMPVEWDGVLDFSRLSLTASAQDQMVSLSAVGDAAEKYLSPRNGR